MTGLVRLREYAHEIVEDLYGDCGEGQKLHNGHCPTEGCRICHARVMNDIASQIEREQAELSEKAKLADIYKDALNDVCKTLGLTDGTGLPEMDEIICAELDKRLMPPGMEWPRFDDGKKVCAGDKFAERIYGNESVAMCIGFNKNAAYILGDDNEDWVADYGTHNRVKRPKQDPIGADGLPIKNGEHVWDVNDGRYEMVVSRTELDELDHVGVTQEEPVPANVSIHPSRLTHTKPVIGADGLKINSGDTVWGIERGDEYVVEFIITDGSHREYNVRAYRVYGEEIVYLRPDKLTHTKPEPPDSWERLEADMGDDMAQQQCGPVSPEVATAHAAEFVRRAKALADREEEK